LLYPSTLTLHRDTCRTTNTVQQHSPTPSLYPLIYRVPKRRKTIKYRHYSLPRRESPPYLIPSAGRMCSESTRIPFADTVAFQFHGCVGSFVQSLINSSLHFIACRTRCSCGREFGFLDQYCRNVGYGHYLPVVEDLHLLTIGLNIAVWLALLNHLN